jgi:thiol-disulfide isomerase/thioredoxin
MSERDPMMSITLRIGAGILLIGLAGWSTLTSADCAPPDEGDIDLKVVKYPELVKAVRDQRGKVVVIDVWADFCIPCKREFHNLVELHQKYADKGLVCMSVSLDPDPSTTRESALKFLQKSRAKFANYLLDEKTEFWAEKWHIQGPPAIFVFDRQGRRAARFDSEDEKKPVSYEEVKKLVQQLLSQAP